MLMAMPVSTFRYNSYAPSTTSKDVRPSPPLADWQRRVIEEAMDVILDRESTREMRRMAHQSIDNLREPYGNR